MLIERSHPRIQESFVLSCMYNDFYSQTDTVIAVTLYFTSLVFAFTAHLARDGCWVESCFLVMRIDFDSCFLVFRLRYCSVQVGGVGGDSAGSLTLTILYVHAHSATILWSLLLDLHP